MKRAWRHRICFYNRLQFVKRKKEKGGRRKERTNATKNKEKREKSNNTMLDEVEDEWFILNDPSVILTGFRRQIVK